MEKDKTRGRRRVEYRERETRRIQSQIIADQKAFPHSTPLILSQGRRKANAKKQLKRRRNVSVPRRIKTGNGTYKGCSYCYPTISKRLIKRKELHQQCLLKNIDSEYNGYNGNNGNSEYNCYVD